MRTAVVCFPDRLVGAPLKLQTRSRSGRLALGFPDRLVGAPLKPTRNLWSQWVYQRFPDRLVGAPLKRVDIWLGDEAFPNVSPTVWSGLH